MTSRLRGRKWMTLRDMVLKRDCGLCQCEQCQRTGRLRIADEVDHVVPLHKGGTDDMDNLRAINAECHKAKTAAEQGKCRRPAVGVDGWPVAEG